ncbi:hypothetical protein D3C71_1461970 [compost metagenome]
MRTGPIFMTRSSNRWVCGPDQACSTASSPIETQSYSVTSVVSMNTRLPMRAPMQRSARGSQGVARRKLKKLGTAIDSYRLVTASLFQTNGVHMGSARGRYRPTSAHFSITRNRNVPRPYSTPASISSSNAARKPWAAAIGMIFMTVR